MEIGQPTGKRSDPAEIWTKREPVVVPRAGEARVNNRCRINSRRGLMDSEHRSYPPVNALCRGLDVFRAVNKFRIASIADIHEETGFPKPSIVRLLETLMVKGYVVRDNMCGGYRVTRRAYEFYSGYDGISQVIEIARPLAIGLTQRIKWPIGIGVIDGHAITIRFWTGAVSPCTNRNTALGARPTLLMSAMGRAYLGFCSDEERERQFQWLRAEPSHEFDDAAERRFRQLLERVRIDGYAMRDPSKENNPYRTTTLAVPIRDGETVHALVSISFFTTAVAANEIADRIINPLKATTKKIEDALTFVNSGGLTRAQTQTDPAPDF